MSAKQYNKRLWKKKTATAVYSIVAMLSIQVSTSQAQSNVSGTLSDGEHRWVAASSPYILEETVIVPEMGTLVIESGVVVQGHRGASLRVDGALHVNGTRELPVVFGSLDETERWAGIDITALAKPSRLTGTFISNSNFVGISNDANDLQIERSVLSDNTFIGLASSGDSLRVSQSHFESTPFGIHIFGGNLKVENSTFVNLITGISISLTTENTTHSIVHSTFDSVQQVTSSTNGGAIVVRVLEASQSSIVVENSIITNSDKGFVRIEESSNKNVQTSIRTSNIWNTTNALEGNVRVEGGLLSEDPLYVDQPTHNLRLEQGSPCIDAGTLIRGIDLDYDLEPRVLGASADMGAFEHNAAPRCGDGTEDSFEQCDDGNASNWDDCLNTCELPSCGDGFINAEFEECDDGNGRAGDGCDASCLKEVNPDPTNADSGSGCAMVVSTQHHSRSTIIFTLFAAACLLRRSRR